MKINNLFLHLFSVLLIMFSQAPLCADTQILRHIEALSRDYYYINIDDVNIPFIAQDIVGGEHEKVYHILGFRNETFVIVLQNIAAEAGYVLRGEGFNINRRPKGDLVTITDNHAWISIGVWAHPYAEYKLTVKKHDF